jgi:hypothetical protein
MKRFTTLVVLLIVFTACETHHASHLGKEAKFKEYNSTDLVEVAKVSGLKKVEYELIKEDITGDPFKIKLYLYSGDHTQHHDIGNVSKECAATFLRTTKEANAYKLIEVNLIGNDGQTSETIFYTSKLDRI